jgi:hypothetical protein
MRSSIPRRTLGPWSREAARGASSSGVRIKLLKGRRKVPFSLPTCRRGLAPVDLSPSNKNPIGPSKLGGGWADVALDRRRMKPVSRRGPDRGRVGSAAIILAIPGGSLEKPRPLGGGLARLASAMPSHLLPKLPGQSPPGPVPDRVRKRCGLGQDRELFRQILFRN